MAAEEQRGAALDPLDEDLLEDVDGERVEPGERLVEHEQVGVVDEGQGQLDPLLVAGGQVLDVGVAPVGEVDPLQPAVGGPLGLVPVQPGQPGVVDDVLADPHLRVHPPLGRHVADVAAHGVVDGRAVPGDRAAVEADEAEDGSHRRGLPRAVRPEEAEQLPPADGELTPSSARTEP